MMGLGKKNPEQQSSGRRTTTYISYEHSRGGEVVQSSHLETNSTRRLGFARKTRSCCSGVRRGSWNVGWSRWFPDGSWGKTWNE